MKPLILDYQVSRIEDERGVSYQYDNELKLNVVSSNGQIVPFIEMDQQTAELMTKTKGEEREGDDEHFSLMELMTKTLASRESDERALNLLDLMTKTRAQRESDDEHFTHN